jgi:hypothetical protein
MKKEDLSKITKKPLDKSYSTLNRFETEDTLLYSEVGEKDGVIIYFKKS